MRIAGPIALVAWALLAGPAGAEDVDHPSYVSWAGQPVGTRIEQRSESDSNGHVLTTVTTTTLKELKADRAIFEVRRTSDATGHRVVAPPEPYELIRKFPLFPGVKREDIGKPRGGLARGEETIHVAGRDFRATWFETRTKGDGGLDVFTRTWMADDVPGRLLRSVTRIPQAKTVVTVELTAWTTPAGAVSRPGG